MKKASIYKTAVVTVACLAAGAAANAADQERGENTKRAAGGVFDRFDKNGDGLLTADEIPKSLRRLTRRADENGDGKISRKELAAGRQQTNLVPAGNSSPGRLNVAGLLQRQDKNGDGKLSKSEAPERMAVAFDRFDVNGDGVLDSAELKRMSERIAGNPGTGTEGMPYFRQMDRNGDGSISRDEVPPPLQQRFKQIDADSDGKLSPRELAQAVQGRRGGSQAARSPKQLFYDQDSDADGRLTRSEAKGQFARDFDKLDANNDGELDFREIAAGAADP